MFGTGTWGLGRRSASRAAACLFGATIAITGPGAQAAGARSAQGPTTTLNFGQFAGYSAVGRVRSMSAAWTVPGILPGSQQGSAGTWIGAQGVSSGSSVPFIQVGITESLPPFPGSRATYAAFWSDTARRFGPQFLFRVRAGDAIVARLTHAHGRWSVAIADLSSRRRRGFSTREEADASFSFAEWIQEDPTQSSFLYARPHAAPYPALGPVSFSALKLDGADPNVAALQSQWMTENGQYLGPTPVVGDAFALVDQQLSPPGYQYAALADRINRATNRFAARALRWTTETAASRIASQRAVQARAIEAFIRGLTATQWPASVQPSIARLIAANALVLAFIRTPPVVSAAGLAAWRKRLLGPRVYGRVGPAARAVHRELGLPTVL